MDSTQYLSILGLTQPRYFIDDLKSKLDGDLYKQNNVRAMQIYHDIFTNKFDEDMLRYNRAVNNPSFNGWGYNVMTPNIFNPEYIMLNEDSNLIVKRPDAIDIPANRVSKISGIRNMRDYINHLYGNNPDLSRDLVRGITKAKTIYDELKNIPQLNNPYNPLGYTVNPQLVSSSLVSENPSSTPQVSDLVESSAESSGESLKTPPPSPKLREEPISPSPSSIPKTSTFDRVVDTIYEDVMSKMEISDEPNRLSESYMVNVAQYIEAVLTQYMNRPGMSITLIEKILEENMPENIINYEKILRQDDSWLEDLINVKPSDDQVNKVIGYVQPKTQSSTFISRLSEKIGKVLTPLKRPKDEEEDPNEGSSSVKIPTTESILKKDGKTPYTSDDFSSPKFQSRQQILDTVRSNSKVGRFDKTSDILEGIFSINSISTDKKYFNTKQYYNRQKTQSKSTKLTVNSMIQNPTSLYYYKPLTQSEFDNL